MLECETMAECEHGLTMGRHGVAGGGETISPH
jgi:hypothetical protein